ncbi:solute carrier family 23 member 1 [Aplysia californica]|uniref:Solute carrier family 23 member 1 n=1 Tax=Aplysia californica TaxID=6500 RepID=A0ABM1AFR0_APLCA|nr:solute carrier family 23 member 1 [Aplysia californica]
MASSSGETGQLTDILYSVDQVPPWYLCVLLAFQQFLTAFGATFAFPLIISSAICLDGDLVGTGELISTIIFVSGMSTVLQSTLGVRLPIIQSVSYSFIVPIFVVMNLEKERCPYNFKDEYNITALPEKGSAGHKEYWHSNLAELQGSLMVGSLVQIIVGFSGLIGLIMRFIGPLTIAPTITLISISLFGAASDKGSEQWYICFMTIFLVVLFSQYLRNVSIPCPCLREGKLAVFALFPVLMAVIVSWVVCVILTETNVLTDDPKKWGYGARTDTKIKVLEESEWFRFPYPGQWGKPSVTVAALLGMIAAIVASIIESVGDYYACARLSGATPPPSSAVNRGIGMEGITCLLAGAWGTGAGNTSYSENIGAIGITKVGSRIVVQLAGVIMILLGCLGKFGALFVTIPDPVVGGLFYVMFGMVAAVGISNLQFVNLNSSRNLFVFGVPLFIGLSMPNWVANADNPIDTGSSIADQILEVLCGTSMFVGGVLAFILDNTIPGTREERGLKTWDAAKDNGDSLSSTYDMPYIQPFLNRITCLRYIPFCPGFVLDKPKQRIEDIEFTSFDTPKPTADYQKPESNEKEQNH